MLQNACRKFQNACRIFQNACRMIQNVTKCMQIYELLHACSYISLHAVLYACMQLHKLTCSYMSLHSVPILLLSPNNIDPMCTHQWLRRRPAQLSPLLSISSENQIVPLDLCLGVHLEVLTSSDPRDISILFQR